MIKKIINLALVLTLTNIIVTSQAVKAEGVMASTAGAMVGAPIGMVSGMMRGMMSKGMEYSLAICRKYGGGIPVMMFAVPVGMVSGGVAGGVTGMIKGMTDGVSKGIDDPFSAESMAMAGDGFLDYEPYDIMK